MAGICAVDSCGKPVFQRGWCQKHYMRWYRHGDPVKSLYDSSRGCSAKDCKHPHHALGLCQKHYMRIWSRNQRKPEVPA